MFVVVLVLEFDSVVVVLVVDLNFVNLLEYLEFVQKVVFVEFGFDCLRVGLSCHLHHSLFLHHLLLRVTVPLLSWHPCLFYL